MKFGELKSVAHNLAASFAGGLSLLLGHYEFHPYREIQKGKSNFLEIDFLTGRTSGISPSSKLKTVIKDYVYRGLPRLCEKHGCQPSDFAQLTVRLFSDKAGSRFSVTVTDKNGTTSSDEYANYGERIWEIDKHGRARRKPGEKGRVEPPE